MKSYSQQFVVLLLLLGTAVLLHPNGAYAQEKEVTFNHAEGRSTAAYHLGLKPGEPFTVVISNTAGNCFGYEVEAVERISEQGGADIGERSRRIRVVHEEQYGGYIVHIRRLANAPLACNDANVDVTPDVAVADLPDNVTLIVTVETENFEVAFAGGFTFSGLTNPVFASRANEAGNNIIERDTAGEDDIDLGVGAFIHAYNRAWHPAAPAMTFGIGVGDSSRTTYYLGPFWRLGNEAFLGGGVSFGPSSRLPAGVRVGDMISDANTLNNLGSKTKAGWFIGVTYTFLGSSDAFEKPFKTTPQAAPPAQATAATPATRSDARVACSATTVGLDLKSPSLTEASPLGMPITFSGTLPCNVGDGEQLRIVVRGASTTDIETLTANVDEAGVFSVMTMMPLQAGGYTAAFALVGGSATIPISEPSFTVQ